MYLRKYSIHYEYVQNRNGKINKWLKHLQTRAHSFDTLTLGWYELIPAEGVNEVNEEIESVSLHS